jgi:hypothetical protein
MAAMTFDSSGRNGYECFSQVYEAYKNNLLKGFAIRSGPGDAEGIVWTVRSSMAKQIPNTMTHNEIHRNGWDSHTHNHNIT